MKRVRRAEHEAAVRSCSKASQPRARWHQHKRGRLAEGRGHNPLFSTHTTASGILYGFLGSPVQHALGWVQ